MRPPTILLFGEQHQPGAMHDGLKGPDACLTFWPTFTGAREHQCCNIKSLQETSRCSPDRSGAVIALHTAVPSLNLVYEDAALQ